MFVVGVPLAALTAAYLVGVFMPLTVFSVGAVPRFDNARMMSIPTRAVWEEKIKERRRTEERRVRVGGLVGGAVEKFFSQVIQLKAQTLACSILKKRVIVAALKASSSTLMIWKTPAGKETKTTSSSINNGSQQKGRRRTASREPASSNQKDSTILVPNESPT